MFTYKSCFTSFLDMRETSKYNYVDVVRCLYTSDCIFGKLYINDNYVCYTLEPLGFQIPVGEYDLRMDRVSPKFRYRFPYNRFKGRVPYVVNVPGRDGILIHIGCFPSDSKGCILVGNEWYKTKPYRLFDSTKAYVSLFNKLDSFKYPIKLCVSALLE